MAGRLFAILPIILGSCTEEETATGTVYEFRDAAPEPSADATVETDVGSAEDVDSPVADVAGADTSSSVDAVDPDVALPKIACDDDAICQSVLGELTGPCAAARCEQGLCNLVALSDAAACDDGNLCTSGDVCAGGRCLGAEVVCDDGDQCTVDVCDPATGACSSSPLDGVGFSCDDGALCTVDDHCTAGSCAGTARDCDDGEPCTADTCDPATGSCSHDSAPLEGGACNDASLCTSGEKCIAGQCRGVEKDCDDGNPCTGDSCLPVSGACVHGYSAAIDGLGCDDGVACTQEDVCAGGVCLGAEIVCPAGTCQVAVCADGLCPAPVEAPDGVSCEDGSVCTLGDTCKTGHCVGLDVVCEDGSPCTLDVCDPEEGCAFAPFGEGAPCDDGDPCTTGDGCAGVGCVGTSNLCDDGSPCTSDLCNPATGTCSHDGPVMDGAGCAADADLCTSGGVCEGGMCVGEAPTSCDDGNPCTANTCDPETGDCGSVPTSEGLPCTDGLVCTGPDTCLAGFCSGAPRTCDDGNECTTDACNPAAGCTHVAIGGCERALHPCNTSAAKETTQPMVDQCVCALDPTCCEFGWSTACVALAQSACGLVCDSCAAPTAACTIDADCGFCDRDGDRCNGGWSCQAGSCKQTAAVTCDVSLDQGCTRTRCSPATGECASAPRSDLCDDGIACTADACTTTGKCSSLARPSCGEQHPCEVSARGASVDATVTACVCAQDEACCTTAWTASCVALAQTTCGLTCDCRALPASATACTADSDCKKCDDADLCNGGWRCDEGRCTATDAVDCSGLGCLEGACDPATGTCALTPSPARCDDGNGCTGDTCVTTNGACTHYPIPGCGLQPPCEASPLARSSSAEITACVCEQSPECCADSWTTACTKVAHFACGAACGCDAEPVACSSPADCASCDDGNPCNGSWTCEAGTCARTPGIVCDSEADVGCWRNTCEPGTGHCIPQAVHAACDDGVPCSVDLCSGPSGTCTQTKNQVCGANHPCKVSSLPESSDPGITACVCALDLSCCTGKWSDACVALAMSACGEPCNCATLPSSATACADDTDCWACNESPCTGDWTCQAGQCKSSGAVTCSQTDDRGCLLNRCSPVTGACELAGRNDACPSVGCQGGVCDYTTGKCRAEPIPGCVAPVDLCDPSALPATDSDPVAACVCGFDPSCCGGVWDQRCADQAVQLCGLKCGCDALLPAQLACSSDDDCGGCDDDANRCNGTWRCQANTCKRVPAVQCGQTGGDCNAVACDPATGVCVAGGDPNRCSDGNVCTTDSCSGTTGQCEHLPIASCGTNTPCTPAATPGSSDPVVTSCTCAIEPLCCLEAWTDACVNLAKTACSTSGGVCVEPSVCGDGVTTATEACDDGNASGGDGCNGFCTATESGFTCTQVGARTECTATGCVPSCTGRVCGSDGCTGSCGQCPGALQCTAQGQCACSSDAECNVSSLWWNDLSTISSNWRTLTPDDPSSHLAYPIGVESGGMSASYTIRLWAKSNANGEKAVTQFRQFLPGNTSNGKVYSESLQMLLTWAGNMPYVDVGANGAKLKGVIRFDFEKRATAIGSGFVYVLGVAGTGGAPGEGPTTITADTTLEPASLESWDAFASGNKAFFTPPSTIASDGGPGPDGYTFYLIPRGADHLELTIDNTVGSDPHGYIVGLARVATKACSAGICSEKSTCGDGIKQPQEACDDGGKTSGDGCSASCTIEGQYVCTVPILTSVCTCGCPQGQVCTAGGSCCAANCNGRACGDNGCGGTCGSCAAGTTCSAQGTCDCVPQCDGKQCGSNGCAGTCGTCGSGTTCNAAGVCEACEPACAGKSCGSDGCGGFCGTCDLNQTCGAAGTCEACVPKCAGKTCGSDGCGGVCGTCVEGLACTPSGSCVTACVPQCSGKVCGDNGCGGSCGKCPGALACSANGTCDECSPVCLPGKCGGNGCNGTCEQCGVGESCSTSGACGDACALCPASGCRSFNFEGGAALAGWTSTGDVAVIGALGVTPAPEGSAMLRLSSGLSSPANNLAERGMCAAGATTLTFKWRFYSAEFLEFCGSQYNDAFVVKLRTSAGSTVLFARRVNDLCSAQGASGTGLPVGSDAVPLSVADVAFDSPDVYVTPWLTATITLPPEAAGGTLAFEVNDDGDDSYDTVALIDDIVLSP